MARRIIIEDEDGSGTSSSHPARAPLDARIDTALISTNPKLNRTAAKVVQARLQRQARFERRGSGVGCIGYLMIMISLLLLLGSAYLLATHFLGLPGPEELIVKVRGVVPAASAFAPTPDPRALTGEPVDSITMVESELGNYPDFISVSGGEKSIVQNELPYLGPFSYTFTLSEGFGDWIATGDNAAIIAPFVCEKSRAKGSCEEVVTQALVESHGKDLLTFLAWDYTLHRPIASGPTPTAAPVAVTPTTQVEPPAAAVPEDNCDQLPTLATKHGLLAAKIGDLSTLTFTVPGENVSYVLNCSSNAVLAGFTQGYITLEVSLEEPMSGPKLMDGQVWYRVFNPQTEATPTPQP